MGCAGVPVGTGEVVGRSDEFSLGQSHARNPAADVGDFHPDEQNHREHGGTVWYPQGQSGQAEPRCTACGHRVIDPRTGAAPRETRTMGLGAIAREMPMRKLAQRKGQ